MPPAGKPFAPQMETIFRKAYALCNDMNQHTIGAPLLLLALTHVNCSGRTILTRLGINLPDLQHQIVKKIGIGSLTRDPEVVLPFEPIIERILEHAKDESDAREAILIDSVDLLIALANANATSALLLMDTGFTLEKLREAARKHYNSPACNLDLERTNVGAATLIGAEGLGKAMVNQLIHALTTDAQELSDKIGALVTTLHHETIAYIASLDQHIIIGDSEKPLLLRALFHRAARTEDVEMTKSILEAARRVVGRDGNLLISLQAEFEILLSDRFTAAKLPADVRHMGRLLQLANGSSPVNISVDFLKE